MKKLFFLLFVSLIGISVHAQEKMKEKSGKHSMHAMKDCVMMENGKLSVMKGGKTMDMSQDMTMSNGTVVMTDGTVKMKSGKTMMLKNGDCVYMDGMVKHSKMKSKEKM